jgi:ferric-dicitrate binding protein FerR (iron transport regulator)
MKELERKYHLLGRLLAGESKEGDAEELEGIEKSDADFSLQKKQIESFWKSSLTTSGQQAKDRILLKQMRRTMSLLQPKNRIKKWHMVYAVASICIMALLVAMLWTTKRANADQQMVHYQTGIGEIQSIQLSDGTQVVLNAASSLVVPEVFSGDLRQVILMGEAYFDVAREEKRSFKIEASELEVKVLGTRFTLKNYTNDGFARVHLEEGKLMVSNKMKKDDSFILIPGDEVFLNKSTRDITRNRDENESAWKNKRLVFHNNTLQEIASTLERKYGTKILILDEEMNDLRFTGDFSNKSLREVLNLLSVSRPMTVRMNEKLVYITK